MSKIIEMDLSNFDFSKVKTMNAMFFSCLKLKKFFSEISILLLLKI